MVLLMNERRTKMIDYNDYEDIAEMFKEYGHLPGQPLEMLTGSENPDDMEVYEPTGGMALPSQMFIWGSAE